MDVSEIGFEYWDNPDGSVGARLATCPDGEIWAQNSSVLVQSTLWLCQQMRNTIEKNTQRGQTQGLFEFDMQGWWIEGEFCVRFLQLPGFGVSFATPESVSSWLAALLGQVPRPNPIKTHD